jgi:methylmalonyl-CoA mutase cobalamin-binding subunit
MKINECNIMDIPAEKFRVVGGEKIITDKKFDTKPIGYFKDAFLRFKKNKSSLIAAIIIIILVIYAIIAPIIGESPYTRMENDKNIRLQYTQLRPKAGWLKWAGVDGGYKTDINKRTRDFYNAVSQEIGMDVIMENYGFDIIDLGRDVAPEKVVETVLAKDIKLVGLSALMTTTLGSMEDTIAAVKSAVPDCKVMVGGAVLTPDFAEKIGADFYCKDAMKSVEAANSVFR